MYQNIWLYQLKQKKKTTLKQIHITKKKNAQTNSY